MSTRRTVTLALSAALLGGPFARQLALAQTPPDDWVADASRTVLFGTNGALYREALDGLGERGQPDVAAALILALRFRREYAAELDALLRRLTAHEASGWFEWMLWQEGHPEIVPHPSFTEVKLALLERIDPGFGAFFLPPWQERARMRLRLEEISWGGVGALRGIPALDNPPVIAAGAADYLLDDDLVFGVEIDGDARAYPLRIMGWHEMFNDRIGGVSVALAYCTLCGSGILYETQLEGREQPLVFGSSGLLYRSNKLMFDWATKSLWNQFSGAPVVGPLVESGIVLETRPVVITSWSDWRATHPDTRVLSLETGHVRDYRSGVVYSDYFASPDLMFPSAAGAQGPLQAKDYVFGVRDVAAAKAWPLDAFADGAVINDTLGARDLVLIGDAATRTVRAYARDGAFFAWAGEPARVRGPGGWWQVREDALIGPDGARKPRIPGAVSYWFAWDSYLGVESELYAPPG